MDEKIVEQYRRLCQAGIEEPGIIDAVRRGDNELARLYIRLVESRGVSRAQKRELDCLLIRIG